MIIFEAIVSLDVSHIAKAHARSQPHAGMHKRLDIENLKHVYHATHLTRYTLNPSILSTKYSYTGPGQVSSRASPPRVREDSLVVLCNIASRPPDRSSILQSHDKKKPPTCVHLQRKSIRCKRNSSWQRCTYANCGENLKQRKVKRYKAEPPRKLRTEPVFQRSNEISSEINFPVCT